MKKCPFCAEEIQDEAMVCRFCNRELPEPSWYYAEGGDRKGPYTWPEFVDLISQGFLHDTTIVSRSGWGKWEELGQVRELAIHLPLKGYGQATVSQAAKSAPWRKYAIYIGLCGLVVGGLLVYLFGWYWWGLGLLFVSSLLIFNKAEPKVAFGVAVVAALIIFLPLMSIQKEKEKAQAIAAAVAEKAKRTQDLAQQLTGMIAREEWEAAGDLYQQMTQKGLVDADSEMIAALWMTINPRWQEAKAIRAEETRIASVRAAIEESRRVVSDKSQCENPEAISRAWKNLRSVKKGDAEWSQAAAVARQLEKCRSALERSLTTGVRQVRQAQREAMAQNIRRTSLDNGIDMKVTVSGQNKDQLTLQWVLMGDVALHKMTDGGSMREGAFLRNLQNAGFRHVSFRDGYNYHKYYTLEPEDERSGGAAALKQYGLDSPISFQ